MHRDASQLQRRNRGSSLTARQESLRAAGANPQLQRMCQLVAKLEHRLKQLTKLLSRILAPCGSKSTRRSLDVCRASSAPKGAWYFRGALRMQPSIYRPHCHITAKAPSMASLSLKKTTGTKAEMRAKTFLLTIRELLFLVLTGLRLARH